MRWPIDWRLFVLTLLFLGGCATPPKEAPVEERSVGGGASTPVAARAQTLPAPVVTQPVLQPLPPSAGQPARPSPAYSPPPAPAVPAPRVQPPPPRSVVSEPAAPAPAPSSPAVVALLDTAQRQQQADQLGEAAASLERALRIDPNNARVWHELAVVRFRQGRSDQAEQLALKSESLAGADADLRARNWRLVALVRQKRGDLPGAEQARQQAESLER